MTDPQVAQLLESIHSLETKLTATITANQASLVASISALTEAHHRSLLEQERRNAGFATRDDLSQVQNQIRDLATIAASNQARLKAVEDAQADGEQNLWNTARDGVGWFLMIVCALGGPILAFILYHVK